MPPEDVSPFGGVPTVVTTIPTPTRLAAAPARIAAFSQMTG